MKRFVLLAAALCVFLMPSVARAQDHGEVGAFADYFRLHDTGTNFAGLGGRLSVNVARSFQFEGELNYDFEQTYANFQTVNGSGMVVTSPADVSILHGLFGPKIQTGGGPVRLFATVKGGFINFRFNNNAASSSGFANQVNGLNRHDVDPTLYPGGGAEFFLGPVGFRAEVGDEIYFNNGSHNNFRVTLGPTIRF
jgi:hypothetical protein